jgi:RNA polymerase sigma-70 factor (ECF subfamily)
MVGSDAQLVSPQCHTAQVATDERHQAFEDEAMPHTSTLLRAAINLTRDTAVAEDLVQDTLLRAWRAFDRFDRGTNCKAWLFRIMLNLSTRVRQKRTAEAAWSATLDETGTADPTSAPADVLEQAVVRRAFETLPQDQRIVLHLAVVDGFTCKEIAGMLSLPMGTVMSRLSRGRAALRAGLAEYELGRYKGNG